MLDLMNIKKHSLKDVQAIVLEMVSVTLMMEFASVISDIVEHLVVQKQNHNAQVIVMVTENV
jgi:hypothetical protein